MVKNIQDNQVKLVIWDLDGTVWNENIAEGDKNITPTYCAKYIQILVNAGIMNSICSKNNYNQAKFVLEKMGIWDFFVFPKIGFFSKGQAVNDIINEMHLRPENVIFVDDDVTNHREVKFYNKGIKTVKPELLENVLYFLVFKDFKPENEDKEHKRLADYKLLEQKQNEQKTYSSNEEFLRQSNIIIKFLPFTDNLTDRAYELITRTNQLNFTKKRISKDEVLNLLNDKSLNIKLINVKDNYGDYGIVGLYVLNKENNLVHFVFSCRIMNMGIEQFVYEYLNFPEIDFSGQTAVKLEKKHKIDYIKIENEDVIYSSDELLFDINDKKNKNKILAIGSCELMLPVSYLTRTNNNIVYENPYCDVNRAIRVGNIMTEHLRSCIEMPDKYKQFCKKYFIHYDIDRAFNSYLYEKDWDYVVLTFHDDAEWKIFKHKKYNFNLTVGWIINAFINSKEVKEEDKTKWFNNNFYDGCYISRSRFCDNLKFIADKLPEKTKFVLITCPVLEGFSNINQAKKLNTMIRYMVKKYSDKFCLVEINDLIKNSSDVIEYGYHLNAENSYKLYVKILDSIFNNFPKKTPSLFENTAQKRKICLLGNNTFELMNAFYILNFENSCPDVISFSDLNKKEKYFNEVQDIFDKYNKHTELKDFAEINKNDYYVVIADTYNYKEFKQKLTEKGFEKHKDFIFFNNNLMANAGDIYNFNYDYFSFKN